MCIPVLQVHLETGHSYSWMTKKMMWINKKLLTIYNGRIHMPSHTKNKIYTIGLYIILANSNAFLPKGKIHGHPTNPEAWGMTRHALPHPGIQSQHTAYLTHYSAQVGMHITGSEGFKFIFVWFF